MFSLRFPVYIDVFVTNENGNNICSFPVGSINLDISNPTISFSTYKRLRFIVNQFLKSDVDVVSVVHLYVLDSDYVLLDSGIKDIKVFDCDDDFLITKIPIHPLTKSSLEYILDNLSNGGGVFVELLSSS